MGCKYACSCGGVCSQSCYEPEEYLGNAEDLRAQELGDMDYEDHMSQPDYREQPDDREPLEQEH